VYLWDNSKEAPKNAIPVRNKLVITLIEQKIACNWIFIIYTIMSHQRLGLCALGIKTVAVLYEYSNLEVEGKYK